MKYIKKRVFYLKLFIFINVVSILLKIIGFSRTKYILSGLAKLKPTKTAPKDPILFLKRFVPLINHLSKYTFLRCMCLETSLIIRYFANRNNIPCEFKIGGDMSDGKFKAHAWVEVNNIVVSELEDQRNKYIKFNLPT